MLEVNDLVLIAGFCVVIQAVFSGIVWVAMGMLRDFRIKRLEDEVEEINLRILSSQGNAKKAEKAEMMQMAMLEAAAIMKNPEIKDKQAALIQVGLKYPSVALDLLSKGLKM